jgi:hypothetical protein
MAEKEWDVVFDDEFQEEFNGYMMQCRT